MKKGEVAVVEEDVEQPQDEPATEEAPKRFGSNIFHDISSGKESLYTSSTYPFWVLGEQLAAKNCPVSCTYLYQVILHELLL